MKQTQSLDREPMESNKQLLVNYVKTSANVKLTNAAGEQTC